MSQCCSPQDLGQVGTAEHWGGFCNRFLIGLVVLALVRAGAALAGDQASITAGTGNLEQRDPHPSTSIPASALAASEAYRIPSVPALEPFSAKDFRPRGHSLFETDPRLDISDDALIRDTSVWQRLSEYRTHDRVQVLTLWKSSASTVSLQADRKGGPSLQWTSRLMNRDGATHGLLDRLFPVSAIGESNTARNVSHSALPATTGKSAPPLGAPHLAPSGPP
jgi:hypothetical protein